MTGEARVEEVRDIIVDILDGVRPQTLKEFYICADKIIAETKDKDGNYILAILDSDQSLPDNITRYFPKMGKRFQQEMLGANFRRVIVEE